MVLKKLKMEYIILKTDLHKFVFKHLMDDKYKCFTSYLGCMSIKEIMDYPRVKSIKFTNKKPKLTIK